MGKPEAALAHVCTGPRAPVGKVRANSVGRGPQEQGEGKCQPWLNPPPPKAWKSHSISKTLVLALPHGRGSSRRGNRLGELRLTRPHLLAPLYGLFYRWRPS